ncbi:MAG: cysteine desulfurase NifS [Planctomycetota bacterium]|nr:MAG: cysteine desulfurase NifS [Planctomycetota bacterium]
MDWIYLDHNATTPPAPEVVREVVAVLRNSWAHPWSAHAAGRRAHRVLATARARVARLLGEAAPEEILFTAGGTAADGLALELALAWGQARGRRLVVASAIEHPAVRERLRALQRAGACAVRWLPVEPGGRVDLGAARAAIDEQVALVSVMWANHETGVLQPVAELAALAHRAGALMHSDAVQAAGRVPLAGARQAGVDLLALSAHKLYGPQGVGALWVRGERLAELEAAAGGSELGQSSADVAGAAGLGVACELVRADLEGGVAARMAVLRDRLEARVFERIPGVARNGAAAPRLPNTASLRFEGTDGAELVRVLSELGVMASSGSACSSYRLEPSHVLVAMGLDARAARGALRLSLGRGTTEAEIDEAVARLATAVARVRKLGTGVRPR